MSLRFKLIAVIFLLLVAETLVACTAAFQSDFLDFDDSLYVYDNQNIESRHSVRPRQK